MAVDRVRQVNVRLMERAVFMQQTNAEFRDGCRNPVAIVQPVQSSRPLRELGALQKVDLSYLRPALLSAHSRRSLPIENAASANTTADLRCNSESPKVKIRNEKDYPLKHSRFFQSVRMWNYAYGFQAVTKRHAFECDLVP